MDENESLLSDLNDNEVEATHIQRILASIIDVAISIFFIIMLYRFLPAEIMINEINSTTAGRYIFIIIVMELYRLIFLLLFGKTIGMMVCQIKYLNAVYQPLSTKEKFIISVAMRTLSIRYYKNK